MSVKNNNKKKDLISEIASILDQSKGSMCLESFFMSEEGDTNFVDDDTTLDEPSMESLHTDEPIHGEESLEPKDKGSEEATLMGVKDEINQIRTIALKTIARLSDYPNSEGYVMMKKIWNMCDKAMEPAKDSDKNSGSVE